jgi:hypothetical protein
MLDDSVEHWLPGAISTDEEITVSSGRRVRQRAHGDDDLTDSRRPR